MRLGDVGERAANLLDQIEYGHPILVAREHAIEPEEIGAELSIAAE